MHFGHMRCVWKFHLLVGKANYRKSQSLLQLSNQIGINLHPSVSTFLPAVKPKDKSRWPFTQIANFMQLKISVLKESVPNEVFPKNPLLRFNCEIWHGRKSRKAICYKIYTTIRATRFFIRNVPSRKTRLPLQKFLSVVIIVTLT